MAERAWRELEQELAAWHAAGEIASFWWRDDDAVEPTAALARLLDLAAAHELPLALAVVPARVSLRLAQTIAGAAAEVTLLQHGFAHANRAAPGQKKSELGPGRPAAALGDDLARGAVRMTALFDGAGLRRLPVLVPPWNRFDPALLAELPALGFTGLSAFGPRATAAPVADLVQCNTHLDILQWKPRRGFLGEEACLKGLRNTLRSRREGRCDPTEATGLLTHHLAHDEAAWDFLARLLAWLSAHPAARFDRAAVLFDPQGASA